MSKALPILTIGDRGLARPRDLSPHDLCAGLPMHARVVASIQRSVPTKGIISELLITPDREIADGRHRWQGAINARLATQECLPYRVIDPADVADVIVTSVAERYDLSVGAKVYMLLPMVERAVAEGIGARAANSSKGVLSQKCENETRLNRVSNKMGLQKLAEELGCSDDMLTLARKTAQLFKQSDERIDRWLAGNSEWLESWETWQNNPGSGSRADAEGLKGGPWTQWRAFTLKDLGHKPEDPATAAIIPENYREVYEARLFSVDPEESMGLGAINKAVGSALATKGNARSDLDGDNPAMHLTLKKKLASFVTTMFGEKSWGQLAADHRLTLAGEIATSTTHWPDEVKVAVASALKGGRK